MINNNKYCWMPVFLGLSVNHANAAPIEGELASNAAALLILLGLWALFMGMRNLRELRHKRLVPERRQRAGLAERFDEE